MERPTKIRVIKKEDGYEILCWDELSGSGNGIDMPINGYMALAEHFRTGAMEISSDELGGLHKHDVSRLLPFTNTEIDDLEKELLQRYGFDGGAIKAESQFEIMDFIDFLKRKGNNC